MRCEDLMKTEIETCRPADTIQRIAQRMREVNIGFMPVCDASGRPVGTLTDRDLALRVCADDRSASATRAEEVMTRETVTCREEDDLEEAERLMARHHKARIMVADDEGRLVGVISLSDVLDEEDDGRAAETARLVAEREIHA